MFSYLNLSEARQIPPHPGKSGWKATTVFWKTHHQVNEPSRNIQTVWIKLYLSMFAGSLFEMPSRTSNWSKIRRTKRQCVYRTSELLLASHHLGWRLEIDTMKCSHVPPCKDNNLLSSSEHCNVVFLLICVSLRAKKNLKTCLSSSWKIKGSSKPKSTGRLTPSCSFVLFLFVSQGFYFQSLNTENIGIQMKRS